jgi:predicted RecB family nuclease
MILTAILILSCYIFIFRAIDLNTVDSFEVRLQDAYWIEPQYRKELPKVGIATLEDLISKTRDKNERDELALRLLIPKENLIHWIEKAQLVQLKGLGIENLSSLEMAGVYSVSILASEDPEKLHERMEQTLWGRSIPKKSKIRIWVREARKKVMSYEL